jgi:hypothetical protein
MCRAELEDSLEDIEYLGEIYENRYRNNEITSYVYNENEAFLHHEAAGLKSLIALIDLFNPDDFQNVTELAQAVDVFLKQRVEEFDNPQVVYGIIKRKINKIVAYIAQRDLN